MQENLHRPINDSKSSTRNQNLLCWLIGSIVESLLGKRERKFLNAALKNCFLLQHEETRTGQAPCFFDYYVHHKPMPKTIARIVTSLWNLLFRGYSNSCKKYILVFNRWLVTLSRNVLRKAMPTSHFFNKRKQSTGLLKRSTSDKRISSMNRAPVSYELSEIVFSVIDFPWTCSSYRTWLERILSTRRLPTFESAVLEKSWRASSTYAKLIHAPHTPVVFCRCFRSNTFSRMWDGKDYVYSCENAFSHIASCHTILQSFGNETAVLESILPCHCVLATILFVSFSQINGYGCNRVRNPTLCARVQD